MTTDTLLVDLLTFIDEVDDQRVAYRPHWNRMTGSVGATVLLQQVLCHWERSGRRPFYKFTSPCEHPGYRVGDSWQEELGLSRHEFEAARAMLAVRIQLGQLAPDALVSYWMTSGHYTWYAVNEDRLALWVAEAEARAHVGGRRGYVYLMQDESTGRHKIGFSKNPSTRLREISRQLPGISLVHVIETDDQARLERAWHERAAAHRVRGEWFDLPDELVRQFRSFARVLYRGSKPEAK